MQPLVEFWKHKHLLAQVRSIKKHLSLLNCKGLRSSSQATDSKVEKSMKLEDAMERPVLVSR